MTDLEIQEYVNYLLPGDRVDLDDFADLKIRNKIMDELEGRSYVISSRNILGEVLMCGDCEGEGIDAKGKGCRNCDSSGWVVNFGEGEQPYNG